MADEIIRLDHGWRLDRGHRLDERVQIVIPPPVAPPPRPKEKGKHMDYIPPQRGNRYLWYGNLSTNVVEEGPKFGLPTAEATAAKTLADAIIAAMDGTDAAANALSGARTIERNTETANQAALRKKVANWKTLPGYAASGSEAVLKLKGPAVAFNAATYKPVIYVSIEAGRIQIDFEKLGADGIAVYMRRRGETVLKKIGTDTDTPYFDTGPLLQPNVPEVREYMARGMVGDDEIGVDSDIVSLTYPG